MRYDVTYHITKNLIHSIDSTVQKEALLVTSGVLMSEAYRRRMSKDSDSNDAWEDVEEDPAEWIKRHCPNAHEWIQPIRRLMLNALKNCPPCYEPDVTSVKAGDKYFKKFPEKVYHGILEHLKEPDDFFTLRLVSKLTRQWVDTFPGLEEVLKPCEVVFYKVMDIVKFLDESKTLPCTNFVFDLDTEPYFYEDCAVSAFLRRFGSRILKISLPCLYQMELESEFEFYESLTNLRELYLEFIFPSYAAGGPEFMEFPPSREMLKKLGKCSRAFLGGRKVPRIPSFCQNLKVLEIHQALMTKYPQNLIGACVNLERLKIPRQTIPDFDDSDEDEEESVSLENCSYLYDLLKVNEHLKSIDLQETFLFEEKDDTPDFHEDRNKEYLLYDLIRERNIQLENVPIELITHLDQRYGRPLVEDLAINFLSIAGFEQVVFEIDLPNLTLMKCGFFNSFVGGTNLSVLGSRWPKVKTIGMECTVSWMECTHGGGRQMVEDFITALLRQAATSDVGRVKVDVGLGVSCYSAIVMPQHDTLFINLIISSYENTPFKLSRLVTSPFENLERLIVVWNPVKRGEFHEFIDIVVRNFEGTLRSFDFETNDYVNESWFRPLVKLKKLFVLKFRFGNDEADVSDRVFRYVLRQLPLEALELEGVGFSKVTPMAIRWLSTNIFSTTVKHFYFNNIEAKGGKLDKRISMAVGGIRTLCEMNQLRNGGAASFTDFLQALNEPTGDLKELLIPTKAFAPLSRA